jgi:hypothetical protein
VTSTSRAAAFRWLLILLILAGAFFGLAPFLAPALFASLTGFKGTDVFMYRLAGAATFGYGFGLAIGYRRSWQELRIPIVSVAIFNAASIGACLAAIVGGEAQPVVYVILLASILFTAATVYFSINAPEPVPQPAADAGQGPDIATWTLALFAIGTLAAAFFGLAPLILGGGFGQLLGYSGADDFVYRQGGAATLGAAVGGLLVLRSRAWRAAWIPAVMALTFNGLSVVAAVLEISAGGQPIAWLILAAAGVVTVGMAVALRRRGR